MADFAFDLRRTRRCARIASQAIGLVASMAVAAPSVLLAQPKLPKVDAPKVDVPKVNVPKVEAPTLPALPSNVEVPPIPKLPGGGAAPAAPAAPSSAPAPAGPVPAAQGPSATLEGPAEDIDLQVEDRKPEPSDGLPSSLPNALRTRARVGSKLAVQQKEGGSSLTIEEIVNPPVRSVSNRLEGARSAPAWIITLSRKELEDRGYTDLTQILDDLPGLDVIRPYGPEYAHAYWRGYRSGTGDDPYLIMIDGLPLSSLFFRDSTMLTALPISDIDHIEVVYGPASISAGANASAGLINVVTNDGSDAQQANNYGSNQNIRATYGGPQRNLSRFTDSTKIVDVTSRWINKDFRLRVTARLERSMLDRSIGKDFEFTHPSYYNDPRIWGQGLLDRYPQIAGQFRSPNDKLALDARLFVGRLEFGAMSLSHTTGLGTMTPADRFQNSAPWTTSESTIFIRHSEKLLPELSTMTLLRYRQSELVPPSSLLLRVQGPTGYLESGPRLLGLAVRNRSYELDQQFEIEVAHDLMRKGDALNISTGFLFRHLELSDGVEVQSNVLFPTGDTLVEMDQTMAGSGLDVDGRQYRLADEGALFALGSYEVAEDHWLHAGARVEHQTYTGSTDLLLRAGYVGTFQPVTVKALYGEGEQTPSPSDITLMPGQPMEKVKLTNMGTQSIEANASMTLAPFSVTASTWLARYKHPIVDGEKIDSRMAIGLDAGGRMALRMFQVWLYYSHYFHAEEQPTSTGSSRFIGDLAKDKLWAGVTYDRSNFVATLLGHFVGRRHSVASNPIRVFDPYVTLDAALALKNLLLDGTRITLRCANLLDARYSVPGIGAADSGMTPGTFAADGSYLGSLGTLNSALPQPRRSLLLTLGLEI